MAFKSRHLTTKPDWGMDKRGNTQQNYNDELERKINQGLLGVGVQLPNIDVADLPVAGTNDLITGMIVYVPDATAVAVPAYFDGAVWRSFVTGLVIV
tara:strand:+ start:35690 stop:35980 length:291 start_codon:yes stop_codon:yes gene_type:complete